MDLPKLEVRTSPLFYLGRRQQSLHDICVWSFPETEPFAIFSLIKFETMPIAQPGNHIHAQALSMSQTAPQNLQRQTTSIQKASIFAGLINGESLDSWSKIENFLLSCLQTGDDKSALASLERLINRFGAENERVAALRGIYQEAVAEDDTALFKVLKDYETLMRDSPTNLVILYPTIFNFSKT